MLPYIAMRYWHPFTESAIADMKADGGINCCTPLHPHFSISTRVRVSES